MASTDKPSEYKITSRWDRCVENMLVKTGYGTIGAGLASFLLFRTFCRALLVLCLMQKRNSARLRSTRVAFCSSVLALPDTGVGE